MNRGYDIQQFAHGDMFMQHAGHDGGVGTLAWVIFGLLLLLLLIAIVSLSLDIYYRSQRAKRESGWFPADVAPGNEALALLGVRYARGEITRDEYVQARGDLGAPAEATTEIQPPPEATKGRSKKKSSE